MWSNNISDFGVISAWSVVSRVPRWGQTICKFDNTVCGKSLTVTNHVCASNYKVLLSLLFCALEVKMLKNISKISSVLRNRWKSSKTMLPEMAGDRSILTNEGLG